MAWDAKTPHPGATPIEHPCGATGITWVEIDGDQHRFTEWVEGAPLPVRLHTGEAGVRAVALADPGRSARLALILAEGLRQVGDQIVGVLDADGQPDEVVGNLQR